LFGVPEFRGKNQVDTYVMFSKLTIILLRAKYSKIEKTSFRGRYFIPKQTGLKLIFLFIIIIIKKKKKKLV
jgi:hypothetical protein